MCGGGCSRRAIKSWPFRDKVKVGVGFMERRSWEIRKAQEKELKECLDRGCLSPRKKHVVQILGKTLGKPPSGYSCCRSERQHSRGGGDAGLPDLSDEPSGKGQDTAARSQRPRRQPRAGADG